eukprot:gene18510-13324_t
MPEVEPKAPSSTKHFKVFFGNLSYFTTYPQLRSLLSSCGPVHAMNICKSKDSDPLYYGFVHYNDIAQVERVVKELHGKKFLGRRLHDDTASGSGSPGSASPSPSPSPSDSAVEKEHGIQVLFSFMCTQPSSLLLTEEVFDAIFQSCGAVEDCVVKSHVSDMRSADDGAPQGSAEYLRQGGYGFVTFSNLVDAQRAVEEISSIVVVSHDAPRISFVPLKSKPTDYELNSIQGVLLDLDCKLSHSSKTFMNKTRRNIVAPRDASNPKAAASTALGRLREIARESSFESPRSPVDETVLSPVPLSRRVADPSVEPVRSFPDPRLPTHAANHYQGWATMASHPMNGPLMTSPIAPYSAGPNGHSMPAPPAQVRPYAIMAPSGEYTMLPYPLPSSFAPSYPQGLPPRPPGIPPAGLPVYGSYPMPSAPMLLHYPLPLPPPSWMHSHTVIP